MDNSSALLPRLLEASFRSIAANHLRTVGRDGRRFVCLESITADGNLADLLRELIGRDDLPRHQKTCAARRSKVTKCDCKLLTEIREISVPITEPSGSEIAGGR